MLKRRLTIGIAALAATAFAGGAYAATQDSTNPRQAFLNDVAQRLHVTPAQLSAALNGAWMDQLQAAVKAGKLTQAQADALKQRLAQGHVPPFGLGFYGARKFFLFGGRPHAQLTAAATYLGLSDTQLRDDLASGKSLAQIAAAQHKPVSGLKSAMTAAFKTKLDKLVSANVITSAQEQRILSRFQSRLDTIINAAGLFHGFRGEWHGMPHPMWPPGPPSGAALVPPAPPGVPY